VTVLSFIYTRCSSAKACPFATGVLNQVHRETGNDPKFAGNLRLVSVSFDPENDTPGRMAAYSQWARDREFQVEWSFLTTASARELQPILKAYNQAVDRRRNPGDPAGPLSHVLRVFLIDAKGMIRNIYSADTLDPRVVLADIETLLMESGAAKDPS
jgi:protein SCO1/2